MFDESPGGKILNYRHFLVQQVPLLKAKFYMSVNDESKASEAWILWKSNNLIS